MELDGTTRDICFDDILLVPKHSRIQTRSGLSLSTTIGNPDNPEGWIVLDNPIIMAPMEFISSSKMIQSVINFGGIGFIQRHQGNNERIHQLEYLSSNVKDIRKLGFSIGLKEIDDLNLINKILSCGTKLILVDVAFGHIDIVIEYIKKLRSLVPRDVHIMSGNVSSFEAYQDLMYAGSDSVRVGIGGGATCTTRVVTGFGVPVLSSIMDIYEQIKNQQVNGLVSDGGIKNNGDIVKALAAGASAVMMGSMFAGHEECDREKDGNLIFRGIASETIQQKFISQSEENLFVEGVEGKVAHKGNITKTLNIMINNIKSGLSYAGCETLPEFRNNVTFIKVSSLSTKESNSRI